jgi:hypothetical protein
MSVHIGHTFTYRRPFDVATYLVSRLSSTIFEGPWEIYLAFLRFLGYNGS